MRPHLTSRGIWLFLSAVSFLAAGAIAEIALLVVLGQVQIVTLSIAFLLCVISALALDRRFVTIRVRDETGEEAHATTGHMVGEPATLDVHIRNASSMPLYGLSIEGFGSDSLDIEEIEDHFQLPSRAETQTRLEVIPERSGRWMLHGFDVALRDPLGLLETRDYLPCAHAFECYPESAVGKGDIQRRRLGEIALRRGGRHIVREVGRGTVIRELRDYQPGDPLRNVAWKQTVRNRRIIARDFEREVTLNVYLLVDMSPSMRGGQWRGRKLEHAISTAIEIADIVTSSRDRVGLMTFDEKLYGHVPPGMSPAHLRRISHHLVGLNSVIDGDLAELDDKEVLDRLVQYLLVQERLDFRRGDEVDPESGVNEKLLKRWLDSISPDDLEKYDSAILHEGVLEPTENPCRRFAQLRGIDVPYRVEARLGMKERGLKEALEELTRSTRDSHWVIVISDLCSVMNPDLLAEGLQLAQVEGHEIEFLVPFTPAYYDQTQDDTERYTIVRELFSAGERDERLEIVSHIRSLGIPATFMRPDDSGAQLLAARHGGGFSAVG